jgi:hypothetical protein
MLGGMMWLLLWCNTLFLVLARQDTRWIGIANTIYWICAMVFLLNFVARIDASANRIRLSLTKGTNEGQERK